MELCVSQLRAISKVDSGWDDEVICELSEGYKRLRNACAEEIVRKEIFRRHFDLVHRTVEFLGLCFQCRSGSQYSGSPTSLVVDRAIQFLGNLTVGSREAALSLWRVFPWPLWHQVMALSDGKSGDYLPMLFNNCLCDDVLAEIIDSPQRFNPLVDVIICRSLQNDWCQLCAEKFLCTDDFVNVYWETLSQNSKLSLLEVGINFPNFENGVVNFSGSNNLGYFSEIFISESKIVNWDIPEEQYNQRRVDCFQKLLELLVVFTVEDTQLKSNAELFTAVACLLKLFLKLTKDGHPVFQVSRKKLSEFSDPRTSKNCSLSICYGLKRSLVSLIGNMAYRNPDIQKLGSELAVLPTVLDCSSLETENPFITQWSILAVRNLCENCPQNQQILAMLSPKGIVDRTDLLEYLELKPVLKDDGSICLKPKNALTENSVTTR